MELKHWVFLAIVLFVGYWLGERYGGALKDLPLVGSLT